MCHLVLLAEQFKWVCRRVEVKKAWAVHTAEQQQKQQQGSDAEGEEEQDAATKAAAAAEVCLFFLPHSCCATATCRSHNAAFPPAAEGPTRCCSRNTFTAIWTTRDCHALRHPQSALAVWPCTPCTRF